MPIYRRVLRYYQPFWAQTLIGLTLSLCGISLNLLKPWPFKIIVDKIIPHFGKNSDHVLSISFRFFSSSARSNLGNLGVAEVIALLCLALVILQFLWGLTNWLTNYIFVKIGLQALLKLRTEIYGHLQRLSLKF